MSTATEVRFRRRATGEVVKEPIFAESTLRWFYEHPVGSLVFRACLNNQLFCDWYGRQMDRPASARRVAAFVEQFGIDLSEARESSFPSFNAFFERKLKPGARPFDPDPAVLTSGGDGKVLVYPRLAEDERLPIKGTACSPAALLLDDAVAARFRGGSGLVLRIAPYDYHRFHFPEGGQAGPARRIRGEYHSVNPIALAKVPDLFCRNKREVTLVESDRFGTYAMIEVGALTVGTIVQTYAPGRVERGQEKGNFRYGGSTVVMFFEPGRVEFDADLVADSEAGLETALKAGEHIGRAATSA